ncbi:MAG TPA: MarR family transcriptional regulator [Vulgatibacter sp.]|nr:MarR family transcriptional regulator [Vulgatibacter sp.]
MARTKADFGATLESAKARSVGQLLLRAARLWNEQAVRRLRATNPSVRPAHTLLLPHIDLEGTNATELAARIGVSKQAVGELVDDLEAQGLLERVPDPRDRRAKLVRFTAKGRKGLLAGLAVLMEKEAEVAARLGERQMESLGRTLRLLVEILETSEE